MPRRTLRQARRIFEEMAPGLNPAQYRQLQREIDTASGAAVSMATEHADRRVNDVLGSRQEMLTELCRLRDELTSLVAEGEQGLLPAKEFNERLGRLQRELRATDRHVAEVDAAAEFVAAVEEDPEAWADSLAERYPHMQPEFSF